MPGTHAFLSASGAHIWMNCTPAIKLAEGIPNRDTKYTQEGTVAHRLAELLLQKAFDKSGSGEADRQRAFRKEVESSEYYSMEMSEYINTYVDWVVETFNAIPAEDKELLTEQHVDFSAWVPGGFGTSDVVIVADKVLTVIDLKYGAGVPVSAKQNPQLMLYGLGAYDVFSMSNDIDTVRMIIVQPRLDSISTYELPVEELLKWGEEVIKPAAALAINGDGEQKAGEWCRFCKVKAVCKARAEENLAIAKYEFREPGLLTAEEVADVLNRVNQIKTWIDDVKEYAQTAAVEDGVIWPGWKLVEGKSNRKYTDQKAIAQALIAAGYSSDAIYKDPELLGITLMEKMIGKKKLAEICKGLIAKPQGAPTLVPETDDRPVYNAAKIDFKEE